MMLRIRRKRQVRRRVSIRHWFAATSGCLRGMWRGAIAERGVVHISCSTRERGARFLTCLSSCQFIMMIPGYLAVRPWSARVVQSSDAPTPSTRRQPPHRPVLKRARPATITKRDHKQAPGSASGRRDKTPRPLLSLKTHLVPLARSLVANPIIDGWIDVPTAPPCRGRRRRPFVYSLQSRPTRAHVFARRRLVTTLSPRAHAMSPWTATSGRRDRQRIVSHRARGGAQVHAPKRCNLAAGAAPRHHHDLAICIQSCDMHKRRSSSSSSKSSQPEESHMTAIMRPCTANRQGAPCRMLPPRVHARVSS